VVNFELNYLAVRREDEWHILTNGNFFLTETTGKNKRLTKGKKGGKKKA